MKIFQEHKNIQIKLSRVSELLKLSQQSRAGDTGPRERVCSILRLPFLAPKTRASPEKRGGALQRPATVSPPGLRDAAGKFPVPVWQPPRGRGRGGEGNDRKRRRRRERTEKRDEGKEKGVKKKVCEKRQRKERRQSEGQVWGNHPPRGPFAQKLTPHPGESWRSLTQKTVVWRTKGPSMPASRGQLPQNPAPDTKSSVLGSWRFPSQWFVIGLWKEQERNRFYLYRKKHFRPFSSFNPGWHSGKLLPANVRDARDWVQSLGGEDPLEEERATRSCILAWRIRWTEEPGGLQSMGSQRVGQTWATAHTDTDLQGRHYSHPLMYEKSEKQINFQRLGNW